MIPEAESGSAWYDDPDAYCPACLHGPRWHTGPEDGCLRMAPGWCRCRRFYPFGAQGVADYLIAAGAYGPSAVTSSAAVAVSDPDGRDRDEPMVPLPLLPGLEARPTPEWAPVVLSTSELRDGGTVEDISGEPPWWSCPDENAAHWAKSVRRYRKSGSDTPSAYLIECGHCGHTARWSPEGKELDG